MLGICAQFFFSLLFFFWYFTCNYYFDLRSSKVRKEEEKTENRICTCVVFVFFSELAVGGAFYFKQLFDFTGKEGEIQPSSQGKCVCLYKCSSSSLKHFIHKPKTPFLFLSLSLSVSSFRSSPPPPCVSFGTFHQFYLSGVCFVGDTIHLQTLKQKSRLDTSWPACPGHIMRERETTTKLSLRSLSLC